MNGCQWHIQSVRIELFLWFLFVGADDDDERVKSSSEKKHRTNVNFLQYLLFVSQGWENIIKVDLSVIRPHCFDHYRHTWDLMMQNVCHCRQFILMPMMNTELRLHLKCTRKKLIWEKVALIWNGKLSLAAAFYQGNCLAKSVFTFMYKSFFIGPVLFPLVSFAQFTFFVAKPLSRQGNVYKKTLG